MSMATFPDYVETRLCALAKRVYNAFFGNLGVDSAVYIIVPVRSGEVYYLVIIVSSWTPDMVRDLVEGINVFGVGHWKNIKSTYDFPQITSTIKNYWSWLRRGEHVSMIDGKWVLKSKVKQSRLGGMMKINIQHYSHLPKKCMIDAFCKHILISTQPGNVTMLNDNSVFTSEEWL